MTNLERPNLGGCRSFYEFFSMLEFLKVLNFSGSRIKELPNIIRSLTSFEILDLSYCSQFEKFLDIFANMSHLRTLNLSGSGIRELPNNIGSLESLETLELSNCSNFEIFPKIHGNMKHLKNLSLGSTPIKELPNIIGYLGALEFLFRELLKFGEASRVPKEHDEAHLYIFMQAGLLLKNYQTKYIIS